MEIPCSPLRHPSRHLQLFSVFSYSIDHRGRLGWLALNLPHRAYCGRSIEHFRLNWPRFVHASIPSIVDAIIASNILTFVPSLGLARQLRSASPLARHDAFQPPSRLRTGALVTQMMLR